jgi:hypothetical protein
MYRDLRGGRADRLIDGPATIWPTYEAQELTIVRRATRWVGCLRVLVRLGIDSRSIYRCPSYRGARQGSVRGAGRSQGFPACFVPHSFLI